MNNFDYKMEAEKTIKKLKDRIAELEKQVSELVAAAGPAAAWMVNGKAYADIFEAEHYEKFTNKPRIPLYTHPAKTLTDEDVKYNVTVKWDDKTTHHKNVSDGTPLHYNEPKTLTDEEINELAENTLPNQAIGFVPSWQWIEFARAILRKAQE